MFGGEALRHVRCLLNEKTKFNKIVENKCLNHIHTVVLKVAHHLQIGRTNNTKQQQQLADNMSLISYVSEKASISTSGSFTAT